MIMLKVDQFYVDVISPFNYIAFWILRVSRPKASTVYYAAPCYTDSD